MALIRSLPLKFLIVFLVSFSFPILFSILSIFVQLPNFTGEYYLVYMFYGGIVIGTYGIFISILAELFSTLIRNFSARCSRILKLFVYLAGGLLGGYEGVLIALLFFLLEAVHPNWYSSSPSSFVLFAVLLPMVSVCIGVVVTISSIHSH